MNTTAVIYARVPLVGDRRSTQRQVNDLSEYAEFINLTISKMYEEHISGARKSTGRPVLMEAIDYCIANKIKCLPVSELSRPGGNAFEALNTVKLLIDNGINLYMQKEQFTLLSKEGGPTMFAPIVIAALPTCAQPERENIKFRLNSGRKLYVERGGKLDRKVGSIKSSAQKKEEYREVILHLKKGYSIRGIAKLTGKGMNTVQKIKQEFN